ncbi:hypothetical protein [Porphyromonas pogonae]|nr:hypothetical protein [Porphyromonas pogonae]
MTKRESRKQRINLPAMQRSLFMIARQVGYIARKRTFSKACGCFGLYW